MSVVLSFRLHQFSQSQKDSWLEYVQTMQAELAMEGKNNGLTVEQKLLLSLNLATEIKEVKSKKEKEPPGKIKVVPVSENISSEDLEMLFGVFGKTTEIDLKRDGKFKNSAFIS